jgi:hypothetical protein
MKLSEQARARIQAGETPDTNAYRFEDVNEKGHGLRLSKPDAPKHYARGMPLETYRTLGEIASGCWD